MSAREPVSVVIPTYNRAALVGRAVESALAAIAPGDEVLVVDDGSTDDTERALAPYAGRVRYVRQPHAGAGRARNRGVAEARRPLLAFLDSDDEWMPDRLELGRRALAALPDVVFTFGDFGARGAPGEIHRTLRFWHRDPRSWAEILGAGVPYSSLAPLPPGREDFTVHVGRLYETLLRGPYVAANTALVRRDAAGDALRFPEDLPTFEDWECFARVARRGPVAFLDCDMAWQWVHGADRLTNADTFVRATTRLILIGRVWGADPVFLDAHRRAYDDLVRSQRLLRARGLIRRGHTAEARRELARVPGAPVATRLASALPGPVARTLVSARRLLSAWGASRAPA